jgi:hypothetical protein
MRLKLLAIALLALTGCQHQEDTGVAAARMEMQDDATCRGKPNYNQCRANLMSYRQQAVVEEQQRQARSDAQSAALIAAGQSLQNIGRTNDVNVNVNCTFGCR